MLSRIGRFIRRKHIIDSPRKSGNSRSPHHLESLLISEDGFCVGSSGKVYRILWFLGRIEGITCRDAKTFKDLFAFLGNGEWIQCIHGIILIPSGERAHQKTVHAPPARNVRIRRHCRVSKMRQIGWRIVLNVKPICSGVLPQCRIGRRGRGRRHRSRWLCRWFEADTIPIQEP